MANRQYDELEWDYEEGDLKKARAIFEIIKDSQAEKSSKASLVRLRKSLKLLGFVHNGPGQFEIEKQLEYRSPRTNKLYTEYADLDKKK